MATAPQVAVEFRDVTVRVNGLTILEQVSAQVPRGSATAIIGPNGAGKTTLLLALLGQIPYDGRIAVHPLRPGQAVRLGYMPQRLDFDRGMPLTVMELMTMGHQRRPLWLGRSPKACRAAREALAAVEAEHLAARPAGALSGGELQRVLLALAIRQEPESLIRDEPAAGVDVGGENLLCELFDRLRIERGFTQIIVTHDLSVVTAHATDVICLNRRVTGCGPARTTLTEGVLAATFGLHLGLADIQAARNGFAAGPQEHRHD
ncbi:MAG: metal ABC transporter ATP-binding protein [Phycisphaerae bacterium]|nr:metal ABC transporter ATP-binding protein [Phycisphaerae bacterium]